MGKLKIRPVVWKGDPSAAWTNENPAKYIVELLPSGVAADIVRDGQRWCYEIAVRGSKSVKSTARFEAAEDAKAGIQKWLARRGMGAPEPPATQEKGRPRAVNQSCTHG
jgi:hypothetical protein